MFTEGTPKNMKSLSTDSIGSIDANSSRRNFLAGLAAGASLGLMSLSPMARLMAQEAKAAGLKLGIQI